MGLLLLLLGFLLCGPAGASGPGWRNPECQRGSEAGATACSGSCRAQISLESPLFPGNSAQPQPPSASLRRYVMRHFRWNNFNPKNATNEPGKRENEEEEGGKFRNDDDGMLGFLGKGGKRSYSMEHFRWGKPVGRKRRPVKVYPNGANEEEEEEEENSRVWELRRDEPPEEEEEDEEDEEEEEEPGLPWGSRQQKRYGGFMGSEGARPPLLTLFRNAIGRGLPKGGQ
ncbi:pro-opiomelanocortin-like [Zonotrichia leucophrys gambelii]|uniref:pro-opiomelanocortin-like n=1 Tax=Zonotrichia leucophrys gambelii TaxID=257770 RepID=UPI00313FE516